MGISDIVKSIVYRNNKNNSNIDVESRAGYGGIGALMFAGSGSYNQEKSMLLSTVYRCVNLISDSVAQLQFESYNTDSKGFMKKSQSHPPYHVLNCAPNQRMTR